MIVVHRITHPGDPLYLNPDLIQTIEAHPDTVVSLTTAAKFVVSETPEEICERIREWRAGIVSAALGADTAVVASGAAGATADVLRLPVERR